MKSLFKSCLSLGVCCLLASNGLAADIVETAVKAGKFNTLAAALGAADLVETLKGPGPFTVFAPTDEAFAKLPAGTVQEHAVAQGSGLYNAGHHEACAQLYESTMSLLAKTPMSATLTSHMNSVLQTASQQTCPTERSWTLRHGIDQMYSQLSAAH